jgi:beta-mannosidase
LTSSGANWIPADALAGRITPEATRDLLQSAVDANMNMIRVWGGGQYEPDYFYELCDELGLLVWQDFMFSCMSYPPTASSSTTSRSRSPSRCAAFSHHACIALWCGDNEVIGSINWYSETKNDPQRYIANYDRLNSMLGRIVEDEDPARRFWPSSPSLGYMDFSDGWHSDTRGDMHFWSVWHEAKPFEHYRDVNPRFASEFGFQSFTSMNIIEGFTKPADRNPSSPGDGDAPAQRGRQRAHHRNDDALFPLPARLRLDSVPQQVQQGLAIKTADQYWRSTKPRCMGTLYWQINDTWPV